MRLVTTPPLEDNDAGRGRVGERGGEGVEGEGRCGDRLSLRDREVDREEGCQEIVDGSRLIGSDGS